MQYLRYISLIILSLALASCGGSSGGRTDSGTTAVMINLGQRATSLGIVSTQTIPVSVNQVRFYISGVGMSPVERTISIAASNTVEETFEITNGSGRHFEVFSYDNSGTLIYYGDTYADLEGAPTVVSITMVSVSSDTPPTFGGAVTATAATGTEIDLSWSAATDDVTASPNIVYLVYMSTTSGGQDFLTEPSFTTAAGATTYTITGLFASTTYYFVVRAKDEAGNIDNNNREVSTTTQTPSDSTPPTFGGAVTASAASGTEINLSWSAATDDVTASSNIVYLIYMSTTSGGEDFTALPNFTADAGTTAYTVTGLFASTTYYFIIRAKDEAGNVESNTTEVSVITQTPLDSAPPTFGGAVTAKTKSGTNIDLSWSAATDDITTSSNIVYLVYVSTTSGGEDFTALPNFTTTAGATTYVLTGLESATTYYVVVRARDEAGNIESNTVEISATTNKGKK